MSLWKKKEVVFCNMNTTSKTVTARNTYMYMHTYRYAKYCKKTKLLCLRHVMVIIKVKETSSGLHYSLRKPNTDLSFFFIVISVSKTVAAHFEIEQNPSDTEN